MQGSPPVPCSPPVPPEMSASPSAVRHGAPDAVADFARPDLAVRPLAVILALTLVVHLVATAITPYELHRDEFLYLAMGRHLQLWRMDFPPGIAILSECVRALLGDSLFAVRLTPALAGTALVALAAVLARELNGGRQAQVFAAVLTLCNVLFMRAASLFQPVVFDQLWWSVAFVALARIARTPSPRWWMLLGAAGGFGLLNKWSILFIGAGMLSGMLLTPQRRALLTPWPYAALLLALVIGAPSIAGQIALDWPLRAQMAGLQEAQLGRIGIAEYAGVQLLFSPFGFIVATIGLVALLRSDAFRSYRVIGVACATTWLLLLALQGKSYYVGPIFPVLFAAGAAFIERVERAPWHVALRRTLVTGCVLWGVVTLPLGLPILPPAQMAAYAAHLGTRAATTTNSGTVLLLPQDYADMLGWEAKVREVARVYHRLSPQEQRDVVILASNYGRAGAIDFYGPRYGLPRAVCPCGTYWQFGPGDKPGNVILAVGIDPQRLREAADSVALVATVREPWGVEEEREVPISVVRGTRRSLQSLWPELGPGYR